MAQRHLIDVLIVNVIYQLIIKVNKYGTDTLVSGAYEEGS